LHFDGRSAMEAFCADALERMIMGADSFFADTNDAAAPFVGRIADASAPIDDGAGFCDYEDLDAAELADQLADEAPDLPDLGTLPVSDLMPLPLTACESARRGTQAPPQDSATVDKLLRLIKKCKPVLERNAGQDCETGQLLEELDLLPAQMACLRGGDRPSDDRLLSEVASASSSLTRKFKGKGVSKTIAKTAGSKTPFFLSDLAKEQLRTWSQEHLDSPYPSAREKAALAKQANLKNKQVEDYFRNYRRRHWEADLQKRLEAHGISFPVQYYEYRGFNPDDPVE